MAAIRLHRGADARARGRRTGEHTHDQTDAAWDHGVPHVEILPHQQWLAPQVSWLYTGAGKFRRPPVRAIRRPRRFRGTPLWMSVPVMLAVLVLVAGLALGLADGAHLVTTRILTP